MACPFYRSSTELRRAAYLLAMVAVLAFSSILGRAGNARFEGAEDLYGRIYNGWKWFHVYCFRCHGVDAVGSNLAPNLRETILAATYGSFLEVVREGRVEKGMQSWKPLLDDDQITDIFLYLRARSDKVLPAGRPDEVGKGAGEWVPPDDWMGVMGSLDFSTSTTLSAETPE